ncbi:hypothetical protein CA13_16850 [Planctomycetes bacterium CA13]|uniref:Uncharacterized protein n=1 Tax=Novipirellula herctigrandis TaxID=2527986 RepID=A0A5C5YYV6_9BACT|nr:hypothetical protein CA13_16850 [Planctomycetes bacterium CA13]
MESVWPTAIFKPNDSDGIWPLAKEQKKNNERVGVSELEIPQFVKLNCPAVGPSLFVQGSHCW